MTSQVMEDAYRPRRVGLRTRLHYSIYSSRAGFRLLKAQRHIAHPVELRRRKRAAAELKRKVGTSLNIDPDDAVSAGELGIVKPDIARFAQELDRLLDDPPEYSAMSRRCHDHVQKNHSLDRAVDVFLDVLPA